mgnify:CR=1 FL=1
MGDTKLNNSLRTHRDLLRLSQQTLAERVGVSRQAIIAIEAGKQVPSTSLSLQLAQARASVPFPPGPIVLGGRPWDPGPVIDADPAARALGVRRGMPLGSAHRLAPEATFIEADPDADRAIAEAVFEALAAYSPGLAGSTDPLDFDYLRELKALAERARAAHVTVQRSVITVTQEAIRVCGGRGLLKRYPLELVQYMRGHGKRKVLFGTNYPMITAAKALEGIDRLGLDAEARSLFLGENAARVFDL